MKDLALTILCNFCYDLAFESVDLLVVAILDLELIQVDEVPFFFKLPLELVEALSISLKLIKVVVNFLVVMMDVRWQKNTLLMIVHINCRIPDISNVFLLDLLTNQMLENLPFLVTLESLIHLAGHLDPQLVTASHTEHPLALLVFLFLY